MTSAISLESAAKMLPAEEEKQNKDKDTAAAAATATSRNDDDDAQLDREVLELMGGWVGGCFQAYLTRTLFLCLRILSSLSPPLLSLSHIQECFGQR